MKQIELSNRAVEIIESYKTCGYHQEVAEVAAKMVQGLDTEASGAITTQEGCNQLLAARWLFDFCDLLAAIECKDDAK